MEKYDQIKMLELVKVEDPDAEGGLTLHFQENKTLKIKNVDGKLVADFGFKLISYIFFIITNC